MKTRTTRLVGVSILQLLTLAGAFPAWAGGATVSNEKTFKRPPYYRGSTPDPSSSVAVMVLPPAGPREFPEDWLPQRSLEALTEEIALAVTQQGVASASVAAARGAVPPQISFGCTMDSIGECDVATTVNALVSTGGTAAWKGEIARSLDAVGSDYLIVLQLRLEPQWIHQKNLSGKKEVRLGTRHTQALPWLTSLESPVWVLQVTGALVDREGKIVRSGAEGIWALRTPFKASMFRAERLVHAAAVDSVRTELVREDLPHRPLAWAAAVEELIHGLRHELD